MAVQFSGGTLIDFTFVSDGTKQNLVSNLETKLVAAGWTVVSGGGGTNPILVSATTPTGQKIRVDFDSTGATNCMRLRLATGTTNSAYYHLLPVNGGTFRIIASKYQFFFFLSTVTMTVQRALICAGVPWIPSFLIASIPGASAFVGWIHGPGNTDTSTENLQATFRNRYAAMNTLDNGVFNAAWMWGENTFQDTSSAGRWGLICNTVPHTGPGAAVWEDGSYVMFEPIIVWPTGIASSATVTRHGQLWDIVVLTKPLISETTKIFEGRTWRGITHSNTTPSSPGTLMHAVT